MKKVWIIVREINAYDQEGAYFHAVFLEKPTRAELLILFNGGTGEHDKYIKESHAFVSHLLNGGGRRDVERTWYTLVEVEPGKEFES